jgi:hypothetical protein
VNYFLASIPAGFVLLNPTLAYCQPKKGEPRAHEHKTMKPKVMIFPRSQVLGRIVAVAALALSTPHLFAGDVNVTYVTGAEVPVSSNGFTAMEKKVNITLNFSPPPGAQLMVVQNKGPGIIRGTFSNLAQGQTIALTYSGLTYHFVANYHGGAGNDLVLLWTTGDELLSQAAKTKLDGQIILALKKSRGQPPFDQPTSLEPDIPIKDGNRVLVDIEGSVSKALLDQVTLSGGAVPNGSTTTTTLRALVPLSQLEALASRADVKSIAPAQLSVTSQVKPQ